MNDVYSIDFTRALPPTLRNDPDMLALAGLIAWELQENIRKARLTLIFHRIDELEEEVLDVLARDMHIDWWNDRHPIEAKRVVIKESVRVHMKLGTGFAVVTALRSVFPNTTVERWYEYGSTHHRFRIILDLREALITADLEWLRRVLITFNRLTVHLDEIILRFAVDKTPIIVGGAAAHGVSHLTHPGDRDISQQHETDPFPVTIAGLAKHAIRHTVIPLGRNFTTKHGAEAVPIIKAGKLQHAVKHSAMPQERPRLHLVDGIPITPAGAAQHAVQHGSIPVESGPFYPVALFDVEGTGIKMAYFEIDGKILQGYFKIIRTEVE